MGKKNKSKKWGTHKKNQDYDEICDGSYHEDDDENRHETYEDFRRKKILESIEDIYKKCAIDFKYYSHEDAKYVSESITKNVVLGWDGNEDENHLDCVFISAQTGSGKNFFIQDVLIRLLNERNEFYYDRREKNKILLISNRVALTRQSKLDLAMALVEITGESNTMIC